MTGAAFMKLGLAPTTCATVWLMTPLADAAVSPVRTGPGARSGRASIPETSVPTPDDAPRLALPRGGCPPPAGLGDPIARAKIAGPLISRRPAPRLRLPSSGSSAWARSPPCDGAATTRSRHPSGRSRPRRRAAARGRRAPPASPARVDDHRLPARPGRPGRRTGRRRPLPTGRAPTRPAGDAAVDPAGEIAYRLGRYTEAVRRLEPLATRAARRRQIRRLLERARPSSPCSTRPGARTSERPARRPTVHAPVKGRVLHLLTNSLPHRQAGYTVRAQSVALAQIGQGLDPQMVTRAGFPLTRASARAARRDVIAGVTYHRLRPDLDAAASRRP